MNLPALQVQTDAVLEPAQKYLGWVTPELAWRVYAGSLPELMKATEIIFFVGYAPAGMPFSLSSFFLLVLEAYGLKLAHLSPHSVLNYPAVFRSSLQDVRWRLRCCCDISSSCILLVMGIFSTGTSSNPGLG
jgi:hypothetical protein